MYKPLPRHRRETARLVDGSSLGTPDVRRLRSLADASVVDRIVAGQDGHSDANPPAAARNHRSNGMMREGAATDRPIGVPTRLEIPSIQGSGTGNGARWILSVAAIALTIGLIGAGVAVFGRTSVTRPSMSTDTTPTTPTTQVPGDLEGTNGMIPGRAVLLENGEIRTFSPDGTPTGTVQATTQTDWGDDVSSDLNGGWVSCTTPAQFGPSLGAVVWHPAGGNDIVLTDASTWCTGRRLQVIDSPQGPTVISPAGPSAADPLFQMVILATGDVQPLDIADLPRGPLSWSAAPGKLLITNGSSFQLYDLDTGEELPMAPITPTYGDFVLSPDGKNVALLADSEAEPGLIDLIVRDLATGSERHRETVDVPFGEGRLSYDGTIAAISTVDPDHRTTVVIDLLSGSRRTLNANGTPL